ncbi:hypothetical protein VNO77_32761 [Canavalia gladiata]|uniref:Uncharacterized protein n=1 Tax=Canavalia gladiata TaxID=3824 RepID=A0AAN9KQE1_CANGL
MAISKTLFPSILICLVILHLVKSDTTIAMELATGGASYHQGQTCVREHVGHAVIVAIVCLQVPVVTMKNVHAMPISPPMVEDANALK